MYQAVANPNVNHYGNRWLVIDMDYNIISKHTNKQSAEDKAFELYHQELQKHDAAIKLMETRQEFLECSKIIGLEKVWSDGMLGEIIEICQQARELITNPVT